MCSANMIRQSNELGWCLLKKIIGSLYIRQDKEVTLLLRAASKISSDHYGAVTVVTMLAVGQNVSGYGSPFTSVAI